MDNIFDLSELTDTQQSPEEVENIKKEEQDRASLFGIGEGSDNPNPIIPPTDVKQNESKLQNADNPTEGQPNAKDVDPTALFFDNKPKTKTDGEETEDTVEDKVKTTSTATPNTIKALAEALLENKVLSATKEELDEVTDYAGLEKLIKNSVKSSEYSDLNDTQKEYLEALRTGVPSEVIQKHQNIMSQLDSLGDADVSGDADLAVSLYSTLLRNKNFSPEKIKRYVQTAIDNNTITQEGKESLEELRAIQTANFTAEVTKASNSQKEAQDKFNEEQTNIKNFLTSGKNEVIPGTKIDTKTGESIYKQMTTAVGTHNERPINALQKYAIEKPVEYKAILNYLFHQGFFTNEVKANTIAKAAKNETIRKFESLLSKDTALSGGTSAEVNDIDSLDSLVAATDYL